MNIPPAIEQALIDSGLDPASTLIEAALVELYRMGRLSHGQLASGLGISRYQADEVLTRHNVTEDLPTSEEIERQLDQVRKLMD
jgi:hypothetical protein